MFQFLLGISFTLSVSDFYDAFTHLCKNIIMYMQMVQVPEEFFQVKNERPFIMKKSSVITSAGGRLGVPLATHGKDVLKDVFQVLICM